MISNIFEKCSKCGYKIPLTEQAYVFNGSIVCQGCDKILRNIPQTANKSTTHTEYEELDLSEQSNGENHMAEQEDEVTTGKKTGPGENIKFDEFAEGDKRELIDHIPNTIIENKDQLVIKLPSFLHSYFFEGKLSPDNSSKKRK